VTVSRSKKRRIQWWLAWLQAELDKIHAAYCKCKTCYFARKLREEFESLEKN
jgi:hypothetical protein